MNSARYSRAAIVSHKLNLETICDMALYEADSQATPEEKKVLKRLAPTLKASAEILTQLMAELDKAAFANRAFEQRCQDLKSQLEQTEKNLGISLTL